MPPEGQVLSLKSLQAALSEERLQAYVIKGDTDMHDAVARYLWNVALASALQPPLHALEVTLRNHIYQHSLKVIDQSKLRFSNVACWLDAVPSLLEISEERSVNEAKASLTLERKALTVGRLISKLSFGFWIGLCKSPYEQGRGSGPALWPAILNTAFPFLAPAGKTRSVIFHALDHLRDLRNRVSHHEPIWDRALPGKHEEILRTIGWMNQGVAAAVRLLSPFPAVHAAGIAPYRERAVQLVRLPEGIAPAAATPAAAPVAAATTAPPPPPARSDTAEPESSPPTGSS